jgi:hypothetical protein
MDFIKFQSSLSVIAAYAKAANLMDLYNQAKEAHDNMTRQYNAQTAPKKKGFWEQFKDNLTFNMDTHVSLPASFLEDDVTFQALYEHAKSLPQNELLKQLREAVTTHNNLYGNK